MQQIQCVKISKIDRPKFHSTRRQERRIYLHCSSSRRAAANAAAIQQHAAFIATATAGRGAHWRSDSEREELRDAVPVERWRIRELVEDSALPVGTGEHDGADGVRVEELASRRTLTWNEKLKNYCKKKGNSFETR